MTSSDVIASLAFLAACVSLFFSYRSWRTCVVQTQAALFPERYKVFALTKDFLRPWFREGRPDLDQLYILVDAWERSKFLFEPSVTDFLRQMWKDATRAHFHSRVAAGEIEGDKAHAGKVAFDLNLKYLAGSADEPNLLVEAFKSMKINS